MKDGEDHRPSQPVSLAALRRALSDERLAAYAAPGNGDGLDPVARYVRNLALASALMPPLHMVEVTLRNNLFNASRRVIDESTLRFDEVECWLDAEPTLLYDAEADAVRGAKEFVRRSKKPVTPGRLVSNLAFGFWVGLCRRPYEHGRSRGPGLWPAAMKYAFPFLPKDHHTRSAILTRLDEIRVFRNRVFHHEPIWNRNVERSHRRLVEVVGWMNQGVADALLAASTVDEVYAAGPGGYRKLAEKLVKP